MTFTAAKAFALTNGLRAPRWTGTEEVAQCWIDRVALIASRPRHDTPANRAEADRYSGR